MFKGLTGKAPSAFVLNCDLTVTTGAPDGSGLEGTFHVEKSVLNLSR